jgi:hypothetical protein
MVLMMVQKNKFKMTGPISVVRDGASEKLVKKMHQGRW